MLDHIQQTLAGLGDPEIAAHARRYFKTGPGEYGEGDIFRGIRVPVQRKVAMQFKHADLSTVEKLLHSRYHEDRLVALLILVARYKKKDAQQRQAVYDLYLANTAYVNNWDLVDSSAPKIVGPHLEDRDRGLLYELAASDVLWERRIAIVTTHHFIRQGDFEDTLRIAELLLEDSEDLIQKAVGWMLRELGNHNFDLEDGFLLEHYREMPRTMLRYAIEKFPEDRRQAYLNGLL